MSEPTSPSGPIPAIPPAPSSPPAPTVPSFRYGEAAPVQPVSTTQPLAYGGPAYGVPPVAPRRTWDLVLTIILLVFGLFGMILGVAYGLIFLSPQLLNETLSQAGYGFPSIDPRGPGTVIIASHVILYLIVVGVGILLLVKKKVAFYVPLAAGVIAAIVFWAMVGQVFLSIPGFVA